MPSLQLLDLIQKTPNLVVTETLSAIAEARDANTAQIISKLVQAQHVLNFENSVRALRTDFYRENGRVFVFVAKEETLTSDLPLATVTTDNKIDHYYEDATTEAAKDLYNGLSKEAKNNVDKLNGLMKSAGLLLPIQDGGEPLLHVCGTISPDDVAPLHAAGYGRPVQIGETIVIAYGLLSNLITLLI